jgi:hypothetical protein
MTGDRRRRLLLAVLLVSVAIFVLARLPGWLARAGSGGAGPGVDGGPGVDEARVAELDVGRLAATPHDYSPGRDPFRYYVPPPKPVPPPPERTGPTAEELAALEAERQRRLREELANRGPQLPQIELTYLGSFGPPERPIAVFSDGEQIYNAVEGDVLQGQFLVAQIGYESVDLAYVQFPQEPPARLGVGGV